MFSFTFYQKIPGAAPKQAGSEALPVVGRCDIP